MNKTIDNNKLSHNGYTGSVEVSIEDNCLHGRVLFIDDIITYEGVTAKDLVASFKNAVDHYITYCKETGKPANKPFSGTFNVRIGQELHRKAAQEAHARNLSLNDYVVQAIKVAAEQNAIVKAECIPLPRQWRSNRVHGSKQARMHG
ncbi:MAG: type II toxin-antitoxin system HicB family antitoxin [Deltaproteobacteria bacterium]|nr:type II toxin-antitoxin system HicB family antitoxin [Deltaproteobacteria bacterium]